VQEYNATLFSCLRCKDQLKCDGTRAETRFRLSAKRTSPFKSPGRQLSRLLGFEVYASTVVMLDTPCSGVMWRVLATHSIRQFPLHFPSRASPCAITFQLDSTTGITAQPYDTADRKTPHCWAVGTVADRNTLHFWTGCTLVQTGQHCTDELDVSYCWEDNTAVLS